MHNIDRTIGEFEPQAELYADELDQLEFNEEAADPDAGEGILDESEATDLAAELLGVQDEMELDQFLGKLIGKVRRVARSPLGRVVGGYLKGVARKALPAIGGIAGGFLGGPIGAQLGSGIASGAGRMFGLELEGLSPEDQELEVAKQFVRFATAATQRAGRLPQGASQTAVRNAVTSAARTYAPGLVGRSPRSASADTTSSTGTAGRRGQWVRRGSRIILYGL